MFDHFLIHYLLTLLQMKREGVAGLFKGVVPVMIRAFPANAVSEELWVKFYLWSCRPAGTSPRIQRHIRRSPLTQTPFPHRHRPRFNSSVPIYTPGWEEAL